MELQTATQLPVRQNTWEIEVDAERDWQGASLSSS